MSKFGYQPETIGKFFSYHPATEDQKQQYDKINQAAHNLAVVILENTPSCADQTSAVRKVIEAKEAANRSIATNE